MIFEYHIGDTQLYTGCIIDCTQRDNGLYRCVQKAKLYISSVKVTLYFLRDGSSVLCSCYVLTHEVRGVRLDEVGKKQSSKD